MTDFVHRRSENVERKSRRTARHQGSRNPQVLESVLTKGDNLWTLDRRPLPFCSPVREVPPPEESCLASGGDSQPEAFCNVRPQIYRAGIP